MNREILFRGKDIGGKWVEGCYIVDEMDANKAYIGYIFGSDGRQPHDTDVALVDPKTVCQCTGLTDKNGGKIFQSDIVKNEYGYIGIVKWECCSFVLDWISWNASRDLYVWSGSVEAIGNIFDNPNLLKE